MSTRRTAARIGAWLFVASGVWLLLLGIYFIVARPFLLPEDLRYIHTTLPLVRAALPGLEQWLARVFTVMGGFIAATGVLTVLVGVALMHARIAGSHRAMVAVGMLTVGLMSAVNFALGSDYRWVLTLPALLWGLALFFSAVGTRGDAAHTQPSTA